MTSQIVHDGHGRKLCIIKKNAIYEIVLMLFGGSFRPEVPIYVRTNLLLNNGTQLEVKTKNPAMDRQ